MTARDNLLARAALAEADAIERLTPGARALLQTRSSFDVEEEG